MYPNPEYDFIHPMPWPFCGLLVDFLYDIKAYDPKDIGVLNLALSEHDIANEEGSMFREESAATDVYDEPAETAFTNTLSQLREFFFVGTEDFSFIGCYLDADDMPTHINESYSTLAETVTFDRVGIDQRPITEHPSYEFLSEVLIDKAQSWYRMLQQWGIKHAQPVEYRVMISIRPNEVKTIDSRTGYKIRVDYTHNNSIGTRGHLSGSAEDRAGEHLVDSTEGPRVMDPNIGFWLLPIEIFDRVQRPEIFVYLTDLKPELIL